MKKCNVIILVMVLGLLICACQFGGLSSVVTTEEKTFNPLAGVWITQPSDFPIPEVPTLFVFNDDYTIYGLQEGKSLANYKNAVMFLMEGTYEIVSDSEVIIKGYDEYGEYMEQNSSYVLEDGKLIIDNWTILELFSPSAKFNRSIVGTWKVYDNDTFSFYMGSTYSYIDNIVFYNDGSYTTNPAYNYGQYAVVQDGNAVQLYSSDGRYEELIKIKFLGCGLIVFDGPAGAYVLQYIDGN